jgi:alkylhydroperoxidase family enzyme
MSRIAVLQPPYTDEVAAQLASMMPAGAPPIGLFRMFAANLPMTRAMHGWGRYELGRDLSLSMRERELVIDRTCARCGCEYEWGVHVLTFGDRVGLTAEQRRSLVEGGPGDPCWADERERLLLEAVDALHDDNDIGDALWQRLAAAFGEPQLMDLLLLCGWYHAISFAARAARLPLEPGAPGFA